MVVMLSLMLGACGKNPARRNEEINSLAGALTDNGNGGAIVKKEGTFSECWDEVNPWGGKRKSEGLIKYFKNLFFPNPTWSALWGTVIPLVSIAIAGRLIYYDNSKGLPNDGSTKRWQKLWYGTRSTKWWHIAIKINACGLLAAGLVTGQTAAKDSAGHDWWGRTWRGIVYGGSTGLSAIALPAAAVVGGEYLLWCLDNRKYEWEIKTIVRSFTFGTLAGGVLAGGIATKNSVAAGDGLWTTLGKGSVYGGAAGFLSLGFTTGAIGTVVGIGGIRTVVIRERRKKRELLKDMHKRATNEREEEAKYWKNAKSFQAWGNDTSLFNCLLDMETYNRKAEVTETQIDNLEWELKNKKILVLCSKSQKKQEQEHMAHMAKADLERARRAATKERNREEEWRELAAEQQEKEGKKKLAEKATRLANHHKLKAEKLEDKVTKMAERLGIVVMFE
jgi:hypothetical protein